MGGDYHKPDRYSTFARNWKLIGITSGKKWQKSSIQDKVLWRVLERVSKSEQGDAIIRNSCYDAGLLDGGMLQNELGGAASTPLATIELMCLLSGKHAELRNINGKQVLRLIDCPYTDVLAGLCLPDTICECHLMGTVHAIDRKSAINRRKKMCAGDPYCEFVIE
ncbi:MAG: hypothetical protein C5S49_07860 [Candidatus Methanogaster sp.]|nr:MAG: hypothetical protein C5S49_07860 [ANME-2 cluster archaeon]